MSRSIEGILTIAGPVNLGILGRQRIREDTASYFINLPRKAVLFCLLLSAIDRSKKEWHKLERSDVTGFIQLDINQE
jgi:hypothetical protein